MTTMRRRAPLGLLVASLISCRAGEDAARAGAGVEVAENAAPGPDDTNRGALVRFAFPPKPELRAAFDTVFASLTQRRRPTPDLTEATLHAFSLDSIDERYVLLARLVPSEGLPIGQWGWAFIAIEREGASWHLSRAYDFKAEEHLAVIGVQDIDGDESADVIYCAWYEGQDEPVPARALGYKNRRWYAIDLVSAGVGTATRKEHGAGAAHVTHDCRATSNALVQAEAKSGGSGGEP